MFFSVSRIVLITFSFELGSSSAGSTPNGADGVSLVRLPARPLRSFLNDLILLSRPNSVFKANQYFLWQMD
ncbi:hypothetical protein FRC15_006540 [Serendipita sp. 397]|nr:hypothetical protein FRC15_006540 [Serendipita sp. 397]